MHATHICYIAHVLSKELRTSNPAVECVYNTRCREGCCGSPPLTGNRDSPRSTAFSVSETQAGKTNSRTSSASTCSKETTTQRIPPQHKHTILADKQRQDRNVACNHQCSCRHLHNAHMFATTCLFFQQYPYTDAAATYLHPQRVHTRGVASGHTQITMPPCAWSFSRQESLLLVIG